jgi:hypothetical protein
VSELFYYTESERDALLNDRMVIEVYDRLRALGLPPERAGDLALKAGGRWQWAPPKPMRVARPVPKPRPPRRITADPQSRRLPKLNEPLLPAIRPIEIRVRFSNHPDPRLPYVASASVDGTTRYRYGASPEEAEANLRRLLEHVS